MAGLEGIDASSMEIVDALGATRYVYDVEGRIARPVVRHTDFLPVAVNRDGERVIDKVRFGMPGFKGRMITNARAENLTSARSWKSLFTKQAHHCLTAVSYIVERSADKKHTYRIGRRDGGLMVVPGLTAVRHLRFTSTGNEYDDPCHVQATRDANEFVASVHDRFVCELTTKEEADLWMNPEEHDMETLLGLLRPADNERYEIVPIAPDVWKRRDDPTAVEARGEPLRWNP